MRHLLDTTDLSLDEIDNIIATAIDIINNKEKYSHICDGKSLLRFFLNRQQEHAFRLKLQ